VSAQGQVTTDPPVAFASIVDAIDARVAGQPASPALIWRDGAVTYAELGAMVRDAQVALLGLDVPAGVPVALVARKSPRAIAFILACLATRRPLVLPPVDLGRAALDAVIGHPADGVAVRAGLAAVAPYLGLGPADAPLVILDSLRARIAAEDADQEAS